ncbi:MAG: deoxyguanosinetriphosphate triphosphohydrolase, partial [Woeseia sp.]
TTRTRLQAANVQSIDDVRAQAEALVSLSDVVLQEHQDLKRYLFKNLYQHDKVLAMTRQAQRMIEVLFERYMSVPGEMPDEFSLSANAGSTDGRARVVADYIAGMTDRYAIAEYERLQ